MFKKILVLLLIAGAMYAMAGESTLGARTAIVERNALIQSI